MDIFDYSNLIYWPIPNTQYVCPIIQSIVKPHDFYCRCSQCKTPLSHTGLIKWFNQIPPHGIKSCPYCQTQWTNWVIYVNSEEGLIPPTYKQDHWEESRQSIPNLTSKSSDKTKRFLGGGGRIVPKQSDL